MLYVCMAMLQGSVIVETVLSNAVSDVDIVVEAVVDSIEVKRSIFQGEHLVKLLH